MLDAESKLLGFVWFFVGFFVTFSWSFVVVGYSFSSITGKDFKPDLNCIETKVFEALFSLFSGTLFERIGISNCGLRKSSRVMRWNALKSFSLAIPRRERFASPGNMCSKLSKTR